ALHRSSNVGKQALLLLGVEQTEQIAGLREVVVTVAVVVAVGFPVQRQRRFGESPVFLWAVERIGLVVGVRVLRVVVEEAHRTILVVVVHGTSRCVDRQRLIVRTEPVT